MKKLEALTMERRLAAQRLAIIAGKQPEKALTPAPKKKPAAEKSAAIAPVTA